MQYIYASIHPQSCFPLTQHTFRSRLLPSNALIRYPVTLSYSNSPSQPRNRPFFAPKPIITTTHKNASRHHPLLNPRPLRHSHHLPLLLNRPPRTHRPRPPPARPPNPRPGNRLHNHKPRPLNPHQPCQTLADRLSRPLRG